MRATVCGDGSGWRGLGAVLVCAFSCAALQAHAKEQVSGPSPQAAIAQGALKEAVRAYGHRADLERGMQIVLGENCRAAEPCFSCATCHGLRGQGSAGTEVPRLTGQSYRYLYYSLRNFASGLRKNGTMQPVAKQLSDADMRDVAEWYAAQRLTVPRVAGIRPHEHHPKQLTLAKGGVLSAYGSAHNGVQGCENCHGPAGVGEAPVYPYLAGQYAGYIQAQLEDFKSGRRRGDPLEIMPQLAARMSEREIHAAAEYFGSIEPSIHLRDRSLEGELRIGAPLGPPPQPGSPPAARVTASPRTPGVPR